MTPRGTLGLCCVYIAQLMIHTAIYNIAQLMIHTAIYTLPFTLHLCYKPLGILQRVTKSQRVLMDFVPRQKTIFYICL